MFTFSLCMIVKNEEALLERCLDSLKGLFEEIVIVDTGSTDRTKEIAAKYTDKVYDFEWINDFSAARNFAFSKCTMDYIYSADADEVLEEDGRIQFGELKRALIDDIEIVQMIYDTEDQFNTTENFQRDLRPKLFKRLRTFTWIDPIHESVNLNPVIYDSQVVIHHRPVSNHSKRDFSIFKNAFNKGEFVSDKLMSMYARELMRCGSETDFKDAEEFFLYSANDERRSEDTRQEVYVVLARLYRLTDKTDQFIKYALKNICQCPCSDMCFEMGMYFYGLGDKEEARIWFENAINNTTPIIDIRTAGELAEVMLAKCPADNL